VGRHLDRASSSKTVPDRSVAVTGTSHWLPMTTTWRTIANPLLSPAPPQHTPSALGTFVPDQTAFAAAEAVHKLTRHAGHNWGFRRRTRNRSKFELHCPQWRTSRSAGAEGDELAAAAGGLREISTTGGTLGMTDFGLWPASILSLARLRRGRDGRRVGWRVTIGLSAAGIRVEGGLGHYEGTFPAAVGRHRPDRGPLRGRRLLAQRGSAGGEDLRRRRPTTTTS
jgi:hypothetical protein